MKTYVRGRETQVVSEKEEEEAVSYLSFAAGEELVSTVEKHAPAR